MQKVVTSVLSLLFLLVLVGPAAAQQDVTVKDINSIPQANIDALNAAGDALTNSDINPGYCQGLLYDGTLCGETVRITAVVVSDPLNSGLASVTDGVVDRIHIFVRDVAAATEGNEGQGIQVVDGSNSLGLEGVLVGDVVTIVGKVDPYFTTMQISPTSIQLTGEAFSLSDPILQPLLVTTSDLNKAVGPGGDIQVNWDNLWKYRGNYVRIEDATVQRRTLGDRVDWNWSSDGGATTVSMYDTSLRYRNDKSDYPSTFNGRTDTYEPPPPGSTINIQGFVTYNGVTSSDPFSLAVPNGAAVALNPMNDDDVVVTEAPINIANVQLPSTVPGANPVMISADINVDPTRQISSAKMNYTTSSNQTILSKNPAAPPQGNTYRFELPALPDGEFGTLWFQASDNGGGQFETPDRERVTFRSLHNGITSVEDIQRTVDDKSGSTPFNGWEVDMDLVVTVQTDPATGMNFVQDGTDPWSGVFIRSNPLSGLTPGTVIRITHADIQESFGLTRLVDPVFTTESTGGARYDYVNLTTNILKNPDIAESYEGMLVSVDDVTVTSTNADAPAGPYGEFSISSDGSEANALRVDDLSSAVDYGDDDDPTTLFAVYQKLDFVRGALYYSFGNSKIVPESLNDIGPVINVSVEEGEVPEAFALAQNYPNPFNPTTSIRYDVPVTGLVTLNVYDSLGRLVRSLVNREQSPGAYTVTFDAKDIASGLYLYRLTAGSKTAARTMVLLK